MQKNQLLCVTTRRDNIDIEETRFGFEISHTRTDLIA